MAIPGATPDQPTDRIGDLILRRWLAQGGMAELYLATPADPARASEVVVLKRVLPQFSSSSNFVRMFAREARLASMLRHPNIVEVHDTTGPQAGDCFFTMEYVHGVDLGDLLDALRVKGGTLPLAHALTIAVGMCAGLHHAHEALDPTGKPLGIVHRDVSPSNVLMGFDGAIKVTDFGVAKALALTQLTEEGTRKGKLCYMSPEQARGEPVDRRADVFAIATVLYELTTMERLFGGDNDLAVMYNLISRPRPSPREVSPGYPAALEAIVMRGVAADIEARYPTAAALQQALEGFAASVGLTLSAEAVGAFVRKTVPMSPYPGDDPEFRAHRVALRNGPQLITEAGEDDAVITFADARQASPTGPNPQVGSGSGSVGTGPHGALPPGTGPHGAVPLATGPHGAVPLATGPHGAVPIGTGPHGSVPGSGHAMPPPTGGWAQVPAAPPSNLHKWSIALALIALLAAIGAGLMVWQASRMGDVAAEPGAASPASAPASVDEEPAEAEAPPAAVVEPAPEAQEPAPTPVAEVETPVPETPAEPTGRRSKKRRTKKKPAAEPTQPEPKPEPTPVAEEPKTKKPSPTDTLLPIRE